ncbi:MAG TPA: EAL domain-containing protein [Terracidiphilus sp.]|nr:EAL domain-containing protein [Terracidiphilus sp.]
MRCPSAIEDEAGRLMALAEYGLDEKELLPDLEPVVHIAARMLDMPIAAVNMIGSDHVFFAASHGIGECDMRRDVSFCAHAITQDDVMVVLDATIDQRFHDNPLVTTEGGIRFYAGVPLHSPSGHALGALCVIDSRPRSSFSPQDRERLKDLARLASDKLELRRIESVRHGGAFQLEDIAANSPSAIVCFDAGHIITFFNSAARALFGYAASEIVGQPLTHLIAAANGHPLIEAINQVICTQPPAIGGSVKEATGTRKDGSRFPIEASFFCWSQRGQRHFGAMFTDLTERHSREDEIYRLANFDMLTGAANRDLLQRRMEDELAASAPLALLAIDLDNFKDINDTLGASAGDYVLTIVADRIQQRARPIDTVSRVGGDEFCVLLAQTGDRHLATSAAEAIIAAISRPVRIGSHEVRVEASCGIALAPEHGVTAEELMGHADLALYQAKTRGSGSSFVFVPSLREDAISRRRYDAELHRAVERNEFELYYQPQVCIADQRIIGAEALLRWNHPERGLLTPGAFLASLEFSSLAPIVGNWVMETACAQWAAWRTQPAPLPRIAVNLFAAQFYGGDLDQRVAAIIAKHQMPHEALELEITENTLLDQENHIVAMLEKLRAIGVSIAFDDFGTGYASLSLLKNYPLTLIKIDQSFIRTLCSSQRDEATVSATIALARNYNLEVIAEGVETAEQCAALARLGCDKVQGYLYGKPMPAARFLACLSSQGEGLQVQPS